MIKAIVMMIILFYILYVGKLTEIIGFYYVTKTMNRIINLGN